MAVAQKPGVKVAKWKGKQPSSTTALGGKHFVNVDIKFSV